MAIHQNYMRIIFIIFLFAFDNNIVYAQCESKLSSDSVWTFIQTHLEVHQTITCNNLLFFNKRGTYKCDSDTLNCTDINNKRQGVHIFSHESEEGWVTRVFVFGKNNVSGLFEMCNISSDRLYISFNSPNTKYAILALLNDENMTEVLYRIDNLKTFISENFITKQNPQKYYFTYKGNIVRGEYRMYKRPFTLSSWRDDRGLIKKYHTPNIDSLHNKYKQ
jgi:hypothetical protein